MVITILIDEVEKRIEVGCIIFTFGKSEPDTIS